MTIWTIRYRASNGVAELEVEAGTLEGAEDAFQLWLLENQEFGVALSITPSGGVPASVA